MCKSLHAKYPLFFSDFNQTSIFSTDFREILKYHKNPSVRAELFHADGQTDMTKLIVAFRSSAKAPKKRNY
jgi:hypothetical protein